MNYVWKVTAVTSATVNDLPEVVVNVKWTYTGTNDADINGVFNGATPVSTADIDPATFVPFDQLTEELVLSWIEPMVMNNADYWQHINDSIDKQIAAKTSNVDPNAPLPWDPQPTPTPPPLEAPV
jgi:hypothetical protein